MENTVFAKTSLLLLLSFVVVGCGASSVVVTPDFNHPDLRSQNLKRDHVRFVKVTDGRNHPSQQIGVARVGMMNREVPFLLKGNLADVVKTILDTLVVVKGEQERFVPVTVSVDFFELGEKMKVFSEEGYFACNLRFSYPVTPDSMGHKVVFSKETTTNGIDVTGDIEPLIYKGLAACVRTFVEGTLDDKQTHVELSADSAVVINAMDSTNRANTQNARPPKSAQVIVTTSNRVKSNELAFSYCQGSKVKTGVRGTYCMLSQADSSRLLWGLGIALTYYDIDNMEDLVYGTFVNFGGRLVGRYFFSNLPTSAYLGGNLGLAFGSERISYGSYEEQSYFFGPNVEEVLGISINRRVSLEFGAFQVAYFGSKLLPSDVGFIGGISIRL